MPSLHQSMTIPNEELKSGAVSRLIDAIFASGVVLCSSRECDGEAGSFELFYIVQGDIDSLAKFDKRMREEYNFRGKVIPVMKIETHN